MTVERVYWDTDAFLGHLQGEKGKVDLCAGTLQRAERGELVIFTSALTIAEVLWRRGSPKLPKTKAKLLRQFFRRTIFRVSNVTRGIAHEAQDLVWAHGIMPKDAIHVATAIREKVTAFETFDAELLKLPSKLGDPPITFRKPRPPVQTTLGV
jgi:predicted nucleic acid-binding protein